MLVNKSKSSKLLLSNREGTSLTAVDLGSVGGGGTGGGSVVRRDGNAGCWTGCFLADDLIDDLLLNMSSSSPPVSSVELSKMFSNDLRDIVCFCSKLRRSDDDEDWLLIGSSLIDDVDCKGENSAVGGFWATEDSLVGWLGGFRTADCVVVSSATFGSLIMSSVGLSPGLLLFGGRFLLAFPAALIRSFYFKTISKTITTSK